MDGCRAGWLAIAVDAAGEAHWQVNAALQDVLDRWADARVLVDMPIGLYEDAPREVETEARRLLGRPRASSVFAVPCRASVYAADYREACLRNRERLGTAISVQAWNLTPKIRELDTLLAAWPALRERVLEAHPELCFAALADGSPMQHGKKTPQGQLERRTLLAAHWAGATALIDDVLASTRRADVARDDIADALVLSLSARLPLRRIPADPRAQAHMVFPGPREASGTT